MAVKLDPADNPGPQNWPYETQSAPPVTTQPYHPALEYPPPSPNLPQSQPYEPDPTPSAFRGGIQFDVAFAKGPEPGYNRRKAPRTLQVNMVQPFIIPLDPVLTFLRLAMPAELRG